MLKPKYKSENTCGDKQRFPKNKCFKLSIFKIGLLILFKFIEKK